MNSTILVLVSGNPNRKDMHRIERALHEIGCTGKLKIKKCSTEALHRAEHAVEQKSAVEERTRNRAWR